MCGIIVLLIFGLVPSIWANCNERQVQYAYESAFYEFATDLFSRAAQEKENHLVISPLSVWTMLSCTWLGAANSTQKELEAVLRLHRKKCFNKKYLANTIKVVTHNESEVTVERSSNIYVNNRFYVKPTFKSKIEKSGLSSFESISFHNPVTAAQTINDYVKQATHDLIKEIVKAEDIDDRTVMIIIDTIFFKGAWQMPFEYYEQAGKSEFYNELGAPLGKVKLMFTTRELNYIRMDLFKIKVLELPYGGDDRYSMFVYLPFGKSSLNDIIQIVKNIMNIGYVKHELSNNKKKVFVQMPRFKISSDINNLKELLGDMGLKAMFDKTQARFPKISNSSIYVSNVIQKANIEVTEKGTVASAASELESSDRMLGPQPEEFIANRPFLFMIVDKKYDIPIFTGAYSKPSVY